MDDITFLNDKALAREKAKLKAKNEAQRQGLSGMTAQLENLKRVLAGPFQRMTYTAAIEKLQADVKDGLITFDVEEEKKDPLRWGLDLRSEHERYLAEKVYKCPVSWSCCLLFVCSFFFLSRFLFFRPFLTVSLFLFLLVFLSCAMKIPCKTTTTHIGNCH